MAFNRVSVAAFRALVMGLLWVSLAQAQERFTVKGAVPLRSTPQANAPSTQLPANTVVTRLEERQGPFRRVRTDDGKTGWLHMFDLQGSASGTPSAAASGGAGTSALRALGQAFSPGSSQPGTVATSTAGIRGLDADDLAKATPNPQAVAAATQFRVSDSQARQFGQRAGLKARQVAELEAPSAGPFAPQAQ